MSKQKGEKETESKDKPNQDTEIEAESDEKSLYEDVDTRWRRIATLGHGATAEVSLWEDSETKRRLAVKVSTRRRVSPKHCTYWLREVCVMSKLRHLNVIRGLSLPDEIRTQLHCKLTPLAMEYCNGGSLRDLCRKHRHGVPECELRNILRDICAGLRYLHRKHIVHRDIKPDNIIIHKAERPIYKITDLGYMKILDPRNITRSFIGTEAYAAPEVLSSGHGRKYNYLVDYWSLGITIFELATGFRPFRDTPSSGKGENDIWGRQTLLGPEYYAELPERCHFTPDFGRVLTQWLRTMLQLTPARRNPDSHLNITPLDVMIRFVAMTDRRADAPQAERGDRDHNEESTVPPKEPQGAAKEEQGRKYRSV